MILQVAAKGQACPPQLFFWAITLSRLPYAMRIVGSFSNGCETATKTDNNSF